MVIRKELKIMYHASPIKGLKTIEPSNKSVSSIGSTPSIFASPSPNLAVVFMTSPDSLLDGQYTSGSYDGLTEVVVIGDEEKFRQQERKGGGIYTVPSENFEPEEGAGRGELVQTSSKPATVLAEEKWNSAIAAMLHYGIKVCFIEKSSFPTFASLSGEEQWELIQKAAPCPDGTHNIAQ